MEHCFDNFFQKIIEIQFMTRIKENECLKIILFWYHLSPKHLFIISIYQNLLKKKQFQDAPG